jgi:DNA-binding NtrC family response regulator
MNNKTILLIEDDVSLRQAIEVFLKRLNYNVLSFDHVEAALDQVNQEVGLILSDVMMPGGLSGYDLLKFVRKKFPEIPIILMTGFGTIEKAVDAMKQGAYDFLVKPFSLNLLETALQSAFLDRKSALEKRSSSVNLDVSLESRGFGKRLQTKFITQNTKMLKILDNLKRIAPSKATVMIQGESGTGKEVVAKLIHELSPRSERNFVAINCAAMPDTLLESELFGHEKGAFTGAVSRQIGKFELSHGGTILLDEITEMSLPMQTKLLRVLQECEIYRVGGSKPIPLNLRVIATTNRDLYSYTKEGHFREDLFYRINVIPVNLPPLRDRGDDVILLANEFISEFSMMHGRDGLEIDSKARKKLLDHKWYGNVRELRNAMERAVLTQSFDVLEQTIEAPSLESGSTINDYKSQGLTLNDIEKNVILATLDEFDGNRTKTANQLGISLRTLRNKLKLYGVTPATSSKSS